MTDASKLKTVADFKKFFKAIPEEQWMTKYYNNAGQTRFCALGHLGSGNVTGVTSVGVRLQKMFRKAFGKFTVAKVNDHKSEAFPQPTPKARILAALNEMEKR